MDSPIEHVEKFRETFSVHRDRVFVVEGASGQTYTYGDVEDGARTVAAWLRQRGIAQGDRIAVVLPNCVEYVYVHFAATFLGALLVPIHYRWTDDEIEKVIAVAKPAAVITTDAIKLRMGDGAFAGIRNIISINIEEESLQFFLNRIAPLPRHAFARVTDDDPFIISYTSGTTGRPKGVIIQYKNLVQNGTLFIREMGIKETDRFYCALPFMYMGGWYNLMSIPFLAGASIVLPQETGSMFFVYYWSEVARYHVNVLWLVPSMMAMLLKLQHEEGVYAYARQHIRLAIVGTAPLLRGLKQSFEHVFGFPLYENYGLSETFFLSLNSPLYTQQRGVGKIFPSCRVEIVGKNGERCEPNAEGEIVAESPFAAPGYDGDAQDALLRNGRVYTGDVGFLDREGYLFVTGRQKDIIIKGGVNISGREVENVLSEHPSVEEVAVVGVPDAMSGDEVAAAVTIRKPVSPDEIRQWCAHRLASFKVPKHVFVEQALPKSVTGKIQKHIVREEMMKKLRT